VIPPRLGPATAPGVGVTVGVAFGVSVVVGVGVAVKVALGVSVAILFLSLAFFAHPDVITSIPIRIKAIAFLTSLSIPLLVSIRQGMVPRLGAFQG